jgi:hypothetical protein
MGLLDIYLASQNQLNILDPDLVTQYPSTNTGTPTSAANPGPVLPFDQEYSAENTYLNYIQSALVEINDPLSNSLNKTNLDIENPGVAGGPNADITTQYPPLVTGTPTNTQNPGGPITRFSQPYTPSVTYLDMNPIQGATSGELSSSLGITNLDTENPGVQGGIPYRPITDPTIYPTTTTATSAIRGYFSEPSQPAQKYGVNPPSDDPVPFSAQNTYSDFIKDYI